MPDQGNQGNATELKNRLHAATEELRALHRELYWVTFQGDHDSMPQEVLGELSLTEVMDFKRSVDSMREFLWKYLDAASQAEPLRVQEALEINGAHNTTRLLQLLREGLTQSSSHEPLSFIERVSQSMKERLANGGKAA